MSNQLTIGERPYKKNIELINLTRKVNLLRLLREEKKYGVCNLLNLINLFSGQ